jgi:hypothetical protein
VKKIFEINYQLRDAISSISKIVERQVIVGIDDFDLDMERIRLFNFVYPLYDIVFKI